MKLIRCVSFALLALFLVSCETKLLDDLFGTDGGLSTDTYQESRRSLTSDDVTFRFSDSVLFLSEYQLSKLQRIEDDSILYFSKDLRDDQKMHVGEIYVLNDSTEMFPFGFVGRVVETKELSNGIEVKTEFVPLKEIFDDLKFSFTKDISDCTFYDEDGNALETTVCDVPFDDSEFSYLETEEASEDDSSFHSSAPSMSPPTRVAVTVTKGISRSMTFFEYSKGASSFKAKGDVTIVATVTADVDFFKDYAKIAVSATAGLKGSLSGTLEREVGYEETKKHVGSVYVPINGLYVVTIPVSFDYYTVNNSSITVSADFDASVSPTFWVSFKNDKLSGGWSFGGKKNFFKSNVSLSGNLSYGMGMRTYAGLGLAQWKAVNFDCAYADAIAMMDANTRVDFVNSSEGFTYKDMAFDALNNAQFRFHLKAGVYAEKKGFLKFFGKTNGSANKVLKSKAIDLTLATLYLLPEVSAWSKELVGTSAEITYILSRNLLLPVSYGMALYEGDRRIATKYSDQNYWVEPAGVTKDFTFTLLKDGSYIVYPVFKILGISPEIQSTESYEFNMENVRINRLQQVSAIYNPMRIDSYDHAGNFHTHTVCFTYDVNATIESLSDIQEWGVYVVSPYLGNLYFPSESDVTNTPVDIPVSFDIPKEDFDMSQKEAYIATTEIEMGVYTKTDGQIIHGETKAYPIVYKQKPSMRYTLVKFYGEEPISEENDYGWDRRTWNIVHYVFTGALFIDKRYGIYWGNWVNNGRFDASNLIFDGEYSEYLRFSFISEESFGSCYCSNELVCGNSTIRSDNYLKYVREGDGYVLHIVDGEPPYSVNSNAQMYRNLNGFDISGNDIVQALDSISLGKASGILERKPFK